MVSSGILFVLTSLVAFAQAGPFTATGNMSVPRQGHTATLLQNGKVLIAGGASGYNGTVWASAELYDPKTGNFSQTGDMTTPRLGHTATLLPDGRVLIAGGKPTTAYTYGQNVLLRSAELYDPATGKFTATANMTTERIAHSATLLNDGRVLIAGGGNFIWANMWFSSSELYDPATAIFTPTGSMTIGRAGPTAALLPGGKVLVAGGDSGDDGPILNVESYDPSTGVFGFAGKTGFPSSVGPAIMSVLANGKVLIDMILYDRTTPDVQLYDPGSMTFTFIGSMTAERSFSSTLLSNGTVLTAGNWNADVYDPATGLFSRVGDLITARRGHTATLLVDGTVLLAGGSPTMPTSGYLNSAELYHPTKVAPAPVLYSLPGTSQGAILHAGTNRVVSAGDPVFAGEALEIYGSSLLDSSIIPPQVSIGGRMADVLWFGNSPGFAGLAQVNVRVPSGVTPGSAVPVILNYLGRPSNAVTIAVQ
jgi:hypothetical protein